jgi:hypothetical protein
MTPTRHEQLRQLAAFGYREATIENWSADRIATVLASRRRDAALAVKRGTHKAEMIDGPDRDRVPPKLDREVAAAYLEEVLAGTGDDVANALLYCGHCLSTAEARALAAGLVALFRGEHAAAAAVRLPFPTPDEAA